MKTKILILSISALLTITSLNGCASAPRITPGHLEVSQSVSTHTATITNIVQLEEREAPAGKEFVGFITGALIGDKLAEGKSDVVQDIATSIGGELGREVVMSNYGKTIFRLTLALNDGSVKQIHVRGGAYVVGRHANVTVNKKSGNITSLVALRT